ncbi:MAG: proteasome assembly chaperone family protein [archaeon]|nr:proteasome assembly chaperone family protein [archaeon]
MVDEHLFPTRVIEFVKEGYSHPLAFGGFVGPSLVGIISASYLIEQLGLHQVAHVNSQHIPPVAVFVGGKLRHPFRVYADKSGTLIVIICEVPIGTTGLYEISGTLLDWLEKLQPREIIILDGVPIQGIPEERETYCVASDSRSKQLTSQGIKVAQSALITGMGGSILNECLSRRIEGISLLTQASVDLPDPGAVLTLINALNSIYKLNVDTKVLEQNVTQLNKELSQIGEQYQKITQAQQKQGEESAQMYK